LPVAENEVKCEVTLQTSCLKCSHSADVNSGSSSQEIPRL